MARSPGQRATQAVIAAGLEAAGTVVVVCLASRRRSCTASTPNQPDLNANNERLVRASSGKKTRVRGRGAAGIDIGAGVGASGATRQKHQLR